MGEITCVLHRPVPGAEVQSPADDGYSARQGANRESSKRDHHRLGQGAARLSGLRQGRGEEIRHRSARNRCESRVKFTTAINRAGWGNPSSGFFEFSDRPNTAAATSAANGSSSGSCWRLNSTVSSVDRTAAESRAAAVPRSGATKAHTQILGLVIEAFQAGRSGARHVQRNLNRFTSGRAGGLLLP